MTVDFAPLVSAAVGLISKLGACITIGAIAYTVVFHGGRRRIDRHWADFAGKAAFGFVTLGAMYVAFTGH